MSLRTVDYHRLQKSAPHPVYILNVKRTFWQSWMLFSTPSPSHIGRCHSLPHQLIPSPLPRSCQSVTRLGSVDKSKARIRWWQETFRKDDQKRSKCCRKYRQKVKANYKPSARVKVMHHGGRVLVEEVLESTVT